MIEGILLELRADLRNLKGVAISVGQGSTLDNPVLLGQLYSAFNEKIRCKFDAQYPADQWVFNKFVNFLSDEILYIDSMSLMHVDMKEQQTRFTERHETRAFEPEAIYKTTSNYG